MTKLQQLESNLIQHEQQKTSILNQINDEKQIEKTKLNSQYTHLINECFKKKYCDVEMFKILEIVEYNSDKTLKVKILKVEPNLIQIVDKMLDDLYIESISSETFETHLKQIVNNLIQTTNL